MARESEREKEEPNHTWMFYTGLQSYETELHFHSYVNPMPTTQWQQQQPAYTVYSLRLHVSYVHSRASDLITRRLANTAFSGCECDVWHACLDVWLTYDIKVRDYLSRITVILSMHKYILIWNVRAMLGLCFLLCLRIISLAPSILPCVSVIDLILCNMLWNFRCIKLLFMRDITSNICNTRF